MEKNSTFYNLVVKSASYQDDGEFECDVGDIESKTARIYVWGKFLYTIVILQYDGQFGMNRFVQMHRHRWNWSGKASLMAQTL